MFSEKVAQISSQQSIFLVRKNEVKDLVGNWGKNRPEDPVRVKAIQAYNTKFNVTFVDGIVYSWKQGNEFKIYDGWTRYCAAIDTMYLLFCINTSEFEQDIIHHFIALNSAVPVPSLFVEDVDASKRKVITAVVDYYCKTYPRFLSASKRPQKPNFNRDVFTEQLHQIWDSIENVENLDSDRIIKTLEKTNACLEQTCKNVSTKASNGKFYLFADKNVDWTTKFIQIIEDEKKEPNRSWLQLAKNIF